jgi:hypothetical protein
MEKFKEAIEGSVRALREAPDEISSKLNMLLDMLSEFINEHQELMEKVLPTIISVQTAIVSGNYAEAFSQLCLLLVLIGLQRKK